MIPSVKRLPVSASFRGGSMLAKRRADGLESTPADPNLHTREPTGVLLNDFPPGPERPAVDPPHVPPSRPAGVVREPRQRGSDATGRAIAMSEA